MNQGNSQITTKVKMETDKSKENAFCTKVKPKMKEVFHQHIKILAKYLHTQVCWKKILILWAVLIIASKMAMIAFTCKYFSSTSLVSLEVFHGCWMLAVFCLLLFNTSSIFPNASCLLVGYLPATTVLHILLIPDYYPLPFIILDAVSTLLAIITMFLILRIECRQIVKNSKSRDIEIATSADSVGTSSTNVSSRVSSPGIERHFKSASCETLAVPQYQVGFYSIDGDGIHNNIVYEEGLDLEPIDFEHFLDEPEAKKMQKNYELRSYEASNEERMR